uniref:Putative secreted protein n=1 Tax=Ixodes ricinus TaxID=34613 RepID=A0A6B0U0Y6_IXORI
MTGSSSVILLALGRLAPTATNASAAAVARPAYRIWWVRPRRCKPRRLSANQCPDELTPICRIILKRDSLLRLRVLVKQ